jgi:hypothetical protein
VAVKQPVPSSGSVLVVVPSLFVLQLEVVPVGGCRLLKPLLAVESAEFVGYLNYLIFDFALLLES